MAVTTTKLRTGDTVQVIKGKDLGKTGKVEEILLDKGRILVESINLVKKHVKPRSNQAGGIITVNRPLAIANVMLVCPACNKKTRVMYQGEGKNKQRICKQCGAVIPSAAKK